MICVGGPLHRQEFDLDPAPEPGTTVPLAPNTPAYVNEHEMLPLPEEATFHTYTYLVYNGRGYLCYPTFVPETTQPGLLDLILFPDTMPADELDREIEAALTTMRHDMQRGMVDWTTRQTAEGGLLTEEQFFRTMQAIQNNTGYARHARLTNIT